MTLLRITKWVPLFHSLEYLMRFVHRKRWNVCLLMLFLHPAKGSCFQNDTSQYTTRHFTDENGLPQNSIKSIAADADGFIWLATENGLVRFDGHQFMNFNQENLAISTSRMLYIQKNQFTGNIYAVSDKSEV